jgi:hypothetical protein
MINLKRHCGFWIEETAKAFILSLRILFPHNVLFLTFINLYPVQT